MDPVVDSFDLEGIARLLPPPPHRHLFGLS